MPHRMENPVKAVTEMRRRVLSPKSRSSQALSGMTTISATRKAVAIHVPSVPVAPISPWIVGSAELTIEMSRVASSAPSEPAATAIQAVKSARAERAASGDAVTVTTVNASGLRPDGVDPSLLWLNAYRPLLQPTFPAQGACALREEHRLQCVQARAVRSL